MLPERKCQAASQGNTLLLGSLENILMFPVIATAGSLVPDNQWDALNFSKLKILK